ncbi:MAG: hypothetical protein DI589_22830 [Shinella sp.]|nr:MAG: hypothetical protein DI589_22830 [Shinella sp.]
MEDQEEFKLIREAILLANTFKREMIAAGERYRIAKCPRCGGSLRLALIGRKQHLRMFCQGIDADPAGPPPCLNLME